MKIKPATSSHIEPWLYLRKQLWPEPDEYHKAEMQDILASDSMVAFLMFNPEDKPIGFIEGALYQDASQKYGYVEGWFVLPGYQKQGLGGRLLGELEAWFLHHAIDLSLSDTSPTDYPLSTAAHHKHGYQDLFTLQIFVKKLE